jgi:hypothetical protein
MSCSGCQSSNTFLDDMSKDQDIAMIQNKKSAILFLSAGFLGAAMPLAVG